MHKGKYVAQIEYEFQFDENEPDILPVEKIRAVFENEGLPAAIKKSLTEWVFDPSFGKLHASTVSFNMKKEE